MSIHSAGVDHRAYVLLAVLTHALVGFTIAYVWSGSDPRAGLVGAVIPDVDLLFSPAWGFPLVHRGLTHTPFLGGFVVGALLVVGRRRRVVLGATIGYLSHLLLDTLTRAGVMWLYPAVSTYYALDLDVHAVERSFALWVLALAVLAVARRRAAAREIEE